MQVEENENMKNIKLGSRLFLKYFISYLLIFLVPLSAMFILFQVWSHTKVRDMYLQRAGENLDMLRSSLDSEFSTMNRIAFSLSQTDWVRSISSCNSLEDFQGNFDYSTAYTALNQLKNQITTNGFTTNIALYFPSVQSVIYKDGIDEASWFFERSFRLNGMDMEAWNSLFSEIELHQSKLIGPNEIFRYKSSQANYFIYIRAITFDVTRPKAYVLFYIPQERITATLEKMCITPNSYSLLLDDSVNILYSYSTEGKELSAALRHEMEQILTQHTPPIADSLSEDLRIISFGDPKLQRFQLVSIYSEKQVLRDVIEFQNILVCVVIVLFFICLIIAFRVSLQNELPVRRLAQQINLDSKNVSEKTFSEIENNINLMLRRQDQFLQSEEEYTYLRLRITFESALNRSPDGFSEKSQNLLHRIGYSFPFFCVAVAQCTTLPLLTHTNMLAADFGNVFLMTRENHLILIFNTKQASLSPDAINSVLLECQCRGFSAGVGGFESISELSSSYNQAKIALDFQLTKGAEGIVCYDELNFSEHADVSRNFSLYFSQLLAFQSCSDWVSCAKSLLSIGISQSDIAATVQRSVFCRRALMALEQLSEEHSSVIGQEYFPDPSALSVEELAQRLEKVFYKLYSTTIRQKDTYTQDIAADISQYVDQHYTQTDFSLGELADHFGISSSKMSILFKTAIGETFVTYLNSKRIASAKNLLAYPEFSIEQIGKMCGFDNVHTFRRVFKKFTQSPPSDYRESLLQKDSLQKGADNT